MGSDSVVNLPRVTFSVVSGRLEVDNAPQRIWVSGVSTGSATTSPLTLYQDVRSDTQEALFGKRTGLAACVRAIKLIHPEMSVDVQPLPDGTTAAAKTITFTGSGFGTGTIEIVIGSFQEHRYRVDVTSASTVTSIASALDALIVADLASPFTSSPAAGVLTLTCATKGKVGEKYPIRVTGFVEGLTYVVANTVAGAGDPTASFAAVMDQITDVRYQNFIWPFDDFTVPQAFIEARFTTTNKVEDGQLWVSEVLSHADILTALGSENAKTMNYNGNLLVDRAGLQGSGIPELPEVQNAQIAAIIALRLTPKTALSQYLITDAALDQFGGPALASLPLFNTVLPHCGIPAIGDGFSEIEINQLVAAGGFILGRNTTGDACLMGEIVTTYLTKSSGDPDPTFTKHEYLLTSSVAKEFLANNIRARYRQSRATQGPTTPGRASSNPQAVEATMEELFAVLGTSDFQVAERGEDAREYFVQHLKVTLDSATGTYTITHRLPIITQAREFNATTTIELGTAGMEA